MQREGSAALSHQPAPCRDVAPKPKRRPRASTRIGGPEVWEFFRVRKEDRNSQGIIHGKRCGTTENIGPAARGRWKDAQVFRIFSFLLAARET